MTSGSGAAKSESKLESGSVGVDRFGRSRSWVGKICDSDSGTESQTQILSMILAE